MKNFIIFLLLAGGLMAQRPAIFGPTSGGGGSGDVVGPASSTDNAVALFDGTTGKLLKNSDITYSGTTLSVPDAFGITSAGSIDLTAGGTNENVTITPSGTALLKLTKSGLSTPVSTWLGSSVPLFYATGEGATGGTADIWSVFASDTAANRASLLFRKSGGTLASPTAPVSGAAVGSILFSAYDGTAFQNHAAISAVTDGSSSAGNVPTSLRFETGTTARTERMRITSTGDTTLFNGSLTLGTAGTSAAALAFLNATSGSITVAPPTGALGTRTQTLQAVTDTFVYRDTTDTLTNKTLTSFDVGASDTTVTRGAAGQLDVEGVRIDTISAANTLSNKTIASPTLTGTTTLTGSGGVTIDNSSASAGTISSSGGGEFDITAPIQLSGVVQDSTGSNGTSGYALLTNGSGVLTYQFIKRSVPLHFVTYPGTTSTSIGSTLTFFGGNNRTEVRFDTTGYTQARIRCHIGGTASNATTTIYARYFTSNSTTIGDFLQAGAGSTDVSVGLNTTLNQQYTGNWTNLTAGAIGDVYWVIICGDSANAALNPSFSSVSLEFR